MDPTGAEGCTAEEGHWLTYWVEQYRSGAVALHRCSTNLALGETVMQSSTAAAATLASTWTSVWLLQLIESTTYELVRDGARLCMG